MSKLDDHLAMDENLWRMWGEDGVTESTILAVDVFFYTKNQKAAEQIANALLRWGLTNVKIGTRRTFLFFKGWCVTGVEEGAWSLEKMKDRTARYVRLAEIWTATYDGCGAMMPDKNEAA